MSLILVGWPGKAQTGAARQLAEDWRLEYKFVHIQKDEWWKAADDVKTTQFLVIWNGWQYHSPLAVEVAKRHGIPYVIFEQGFLHQKRSWSFDTQGFNKDSSLNGSLAWVSQEHLSELNVVRERLQRQHPLEPKGHVLAICQIHNDTQILYNTPYRGMQEFIEDLAVMYPRQEVIIRPHPGSHAKRQPSNDMHRVEGGGDFLATASKASVIVGLTSTCLIEAGILGVPVVALGDCPLRTHARRDHDRLLAGYLAHRIKNHGRPLAPFLESMGVRPL